MGRQQALGVLGAMKKNGTYNANGTVAQLWGGPTDANAFWFKSGNDDILNPLFRTKKVKKGPAKFVPLWDSANAQTIFEQMLVQTSNNIQGVVAANDGIAGAVVATLKAKGLKPIPLSGQDATVQGVQNIISGWQTMTVYKYVPAEANAAAAAAIALYKGKKPPSNGTRPNGKKKQPTFVIPVYFDHQGELHAAVPGRVPQAERGVLRASTRSTASSRIAQAMEARPARLHSLSVRTRHS